MCVVRLLERLAVIVRRPLSVEQLSVVEAIINHIITWRDDNSPARVRRAQEEPRCVGWDLFNWLNGIVLLRKPISEIRSFICHTGSHSVTGHSTQVNTPGHDSTDRLVLDLPTLEG